MKRPQGELQNIITYLCFKANPLSTRKLVKLVYLVEVYHCQMFGKRLTNVPFKHYFYGAWSPEIEKSLEELCEEGIIKEETVETREGNLASVPKPAIDRTQVRLSATAIKAIEMVLADFGAANPSDVVEFTKKTLPFLNTPFDEEIDFSRCDPVVVYAKEKGISIKEAATEDILSNEAFVEKLREAEKSLREGGRLLTHEEILVVASPLKFVPFYTEVFLECLEKHRDQQIRVLELVERILQAPKIQQAHFLGIKRGVDLRGKRRRHMSNNFVIIYIVCEECLAKGHRAKGYNNCHFCTGKPSNRVIFVAFDKWDDIYSRGWEITYPPDFTP